MGFQIRIVGVFVTLETRGFHNVGEDIAYAGVHIFNGQGALVDSVHDLADEHVHTGFQQVVDGMNLLHGLAGAGPVGHHNALEAPLVTQDGGEQLAVGLGVGTVDTVVGTHDGPGVGLLHGNLEALEIELAKGAGIDAGVVVHAVGLLAVAGEVLDGYAHAVLLDTAGVGGGHLTGNDGVFGEILEVTAAERIAVQVHARSQQDVGPVFLDLVAHGGGEFLYQVGVEGRCQHGAHRETGAVESLVRAGTGGIDPEAGRAVGEDGLGDAQARDGAGGTGSTGNQDFVRAREAPYHATPAGADQQRGFFFQGHGLQDLVDVVLVQLRLCHKRDGAKSRTQHQEGFLHKRLLVNG